MEVWYQIVSVRCLVGRTEPTDGSATRRFGFVRLRGFELFFFGSRWSLGGVGPRSLEAILATLGGMSEVGWSLEHSGWH